MEKSFVTTADVAEYLGYSVSYVRKLCNTRSIPFYKFGRSIRFREGEVREWAENGRINAVEQDI